MQEFYETIPLVVESSSSVLTLLLAGQPDVSTHKVKHEQIVHIDKLGIIDKQKQRKHAGLENAATICGII